MDPGTTQQPQFFRLGHEPGQTHAIADPESFDLGFQRGSRIAGTGDDQLAFRHVPHQISKGSHDQVNALVTFEPAQVQEGRFRETTLRWIRPMVLHVDAVLDDPNLLRPKATRYQILRRAFRDGNDWLTAI